MYQRIQFKENRLSIGALVTFADLLGSEVINDRFPIIMEVAKTVASVGIRNRATIISI